MWVNAEKPKISWITVPKKDGEEWVRYQKPFYAKKPVRSAVFRFECDCVCALYVNGDLAACGNGRMPERVNAHEITSRLHAGENTLSLVLGSAYFQQRGLDIKSARGFWLNTAAAELCVEYEDGEREILATDPTWTAVSDGVRQDVIETAIVTEAEYRMMWANAAVWPERSLHRRKIPREITEVVGEDYLRYAERDIPECVSPVAVLSTNLNAQNGALVTDPKSAEPPFVIYDFGRLHVGFTEVVYHTASDATLTFIHDVCEDPADFDAVPLNERVAMLAVTLPLKSDEEKILNLRRRAFRYLKLSFPQGVSVTVKDVRLRVCMFPEIQTGWFHSSDPLLNEAWETGKYTLNVNKQQEYESCPRYEMQFFAGDGAIDAWIDEYAFGGHDLLNASLSVKHEESSTGVLFTDKWNRNAIQWDYFAWRILCIHLHYKSTGDREFLERYYEEGRANLLWQLERRNSRGLIFQRPCFVSSFRYVLGQTEWTCSSSRVGEKTALNALLYASLTAMAEMAVDMGEDENAAQWSLLAKEVRTAINTHLWSEEKRCYVDSLDTFVAQDANTLAILFGVADGERRDAALDTMRERLWSPYGSTILDSYVPHTRGGNTLISPFMTALEAKARFEADRPEEGLLLIRRCWGTMLAKGAKTFWEFSPNNATDAWKYRAHAWSAGCTWLLSAYILGIRAADVDYRSILFAPRPCDLTELSGVVPTPSGVMAASCRTVSVDGHAVREFVLAVPRGVKVKADLPKDSTLRIVTYAE